MSRSSAPKRKAGEVKLPEPGHDAAERKRVLNILAQRRYRQRKKEHIKNLEAQAQFPTPDTDIHLDGTFDDYCAASAQTGGGTSSDVFGVCDVVTTAPASHATVGISHHSSLTATSSYTRSEDLHSETANESQTDRSDSGPDAGHPEWTFSTNSPDSLQIWDTSILLPSLPGTPPSSVEDTPPSTEATTPATSLSSIKTCQELGRRGASSILPEDHIARHDFPDEANFKILELDLLRAGMSIAKQMHIDDLLFELTAQSPYTDRSLTAMTFDHLPVNLRPTQVQLTIPHHPFFDVLPWPTVRNKLILVFSQEPGMRPPQAASPTAMLEFAYDIEDSAEGVRICGDNAHSDQSWEVGEKVFQRWWWAFDTAIINRSNQLRTNRGASMLGVGRVLNEVA